MDNLNNPGTPDVWTLLLGSAPEEPAAPGRRIWVVLESDSEYNDEVNVIQGEGGLPLYWYATQEEARAKADALNAAWRANENPHDWDYDGDLENIDFYVVAPCIAGDP